MSKKQLPQQFYKDLLHGATYPELTENYDVSKYTIRERLKTIQDAGYEVERSQANPQGKRYNKIHEPEAELLNIMDLVQPVNESTEQIQKQKAKQTVTKDANAALKRIEEQTLKALEQNGTLQPSTHPRATPDGQDLVVHCTDDHFGEVITDARGNKMFDSQIAEQRVRQRFAKVRGLVDEKENVDTIHILLGGDHVTNESIYDGQQFDIDATIDEQLNHATGVYLEELEKLSETVDFVQVVCQAGNHGEMRVKGSSNQANADRFLYDRLQLLLDQKNLGNICFVKSDRKDFTNFQMRNGEWKGHLRHGHYVSNHIGTSSPQSDWRSFLLEHRFDIAYRGHYHTHKIEHVNSTPVVMSPSIKPAGEYEGTLAVFDRPMAYIHGVTDDSPLAWTEYITYE